MIKTLAENADALAALASLATIVSGLGLVGAAWISARQFVQSQKFSRQQRIREFYADYLKDSIERGQYWNQYWLRSNLSDEDRVKYAGYVAYMLTVLEEVIDLEGESDWERSVLADLEYHSGYFSSKDFSPYIDCYGPRLKRLIRQAANEALRREEIG